MPLDVIGPHPFACDAEGRQITRIGTVFPEYNTLFTQPPAVHAWQRLNFIARLNARRAADGLPALTSAEEGRLCENSVDVIFESDTIFIRPAPDRMDLAFATDELLQGLVSKRCIKFLSIADPRVRDAIKKRGEWWRLSSIPKTRAGKEQIIFGSKVAIHGLPIYFYNRLTGTRWLTLHAFEDLAQLDPPALALHLREIAEHAVRRNRLDRREIDFFGADPRCFGAPEFSAVLDEQLTPADLASKYEELRKKFRAAVPPELAREDCGNPAWSQQMLSTLFLEGNEAQTEHILSGLSPEFFLQIEWLPAGRFEEGEFLFDSVFDEAANHPEDEDVQRLCDARAQGIIFNLIRECGDLEYVNIGRVPEPLSLGRPEKRGRRGVYIAEFKSRSDALPARRFMRLQKWSVWEHLNEGRDLLQAIEQSEEYTDYWLDRRLGCRQLGMNLTRQVAMRRLSEVYTGRNTVYQGRTIRTTYFERDYLPGIASDKLPKENYRRPGYAVKLAALLGQAAASSLIVGRALEEGKRPVFDDGDEVVREGPDALPAEIMLGDHSGSFGEYKLPLETFAAHYARPINSRANLVPDAPAFACAFLEAFRLHFLHIQGDYRKRRRAFDTLFKHSKFDPAGSYSFRWAQILRRLDETNVDTVINAIQKHLEVPYPPDLLAAPRVAGGAKTVSVN